MTTLFTPAGNPDKPKVKDTNLKDYYPSINLTNSWDSIGPYFDDAVVQFLQPYIDLTTYDSIAALSSSVDLHRLLRKTVAYYGIYLALPHVHGVISDIGVQHNSSENSQPVSQWAFKAKRWAVLKQADTYMDLLLDAMLGSEEAGLVGWQETQQITSTFFSNLTDISQYSRLKGYRAVVALQPFIKKAELDLQELVCDGDTYQLLTAAEGTMAYLCQTFIADQAIYLGLPKMSMIYEDGGFMMVSQTDGFDSKSPALTSWSDIEQLRDSLASDVSITKDRILKAIQADPATYSSWATMMMDSEDEGGVTGEDLGGMFI